MIKAISEETDRPETLETQYDKLSPTLFKVSVVPEGVANITTNLDDYVNFDWNKLTYTVIQKYPLIYREFRDKLRTSTLHKLLVRNLPIHGQISQVISYLPGYYQFIKPELTTRWIKLYQAKLKAIYDEDMFDIKWYSPNETDYRWARDRMAKNREICLKLTMWGLIPPTPLSLRATSPWMR